MVKIIRNQVNNGRTNREIAESNSNSLSCATKLTDKISQGLSDREIIKKKGTKPSSNTENKVLVVSHSTI